jgi:hypothetical protein
MTIENVTSSVASEEDTSFMIIAKAHLIVTSFGMIGNGICIFVFSQKNFLVRKFNLYLLILAIAEFLFCCIVFSNTFVFLIFPNKFMTDLSIIPCFVTEYAVNVIDAFCVFLTLLLSADRLKAILDPITSRLFFTNIYPKRITFTSLILILAIKSPQIILAQRTFLNDPIQLLENNSISCNFSDLTQDMLPICHECDNENKKLYIIICGIILPILLNIIPTILILILNITLLVNLKNYKNRTLNLISKQRNKTVKQLKATRQKSHHFTIIIIGIWLLLTSSPYYTINTIIRLSNLNISNFVISENFYLYQAIFSVFFNSNHCINIIIYFIFHKTFRFKSMKILFKLFKSNKTRENPADENGVWEKSSCQRSRKSSIFQFRNLSNSWEIHSKNKKNSILSIQCKAYKNSVVGNKLSDVIEEKRDENEK